MKPEYELLRGAFAPTRLLWRGQDMGGVKEWYFDAPVGRDVVGTVLNQHREGPWWTPLTEISLASDPENPKVVDGGEERAQHDMIVANSFFLHEMFGLGHIVRTNGSVAAFWDGVECHVVRMENLHRVAVKLSQVKGAALSRAKRVSKSAKFVESVFKDLIS